MHYLVVFLELLYVYGEGTNSMYYYLLVVECSLRPPRAKF